MNNSPEGVAEVVEALKTRGFRYAGQGPGGRVRLTGPLRTSLSTHECEFDIDPRFYEMPRVRLLEIPAALRPVAPHVANDGGLCYLAKGSVVFDMFDPVGQTLACLERAEVVLEKVLKHEMVEDMEEEFFSNWGEAICFMDVQGTEPGQSRSFAVGTSDSTTAVVTDNENHTKKKLQAIGWGITDKTLLTYRIRTKAKPRPNHEEWPPTTLRAVLTWQGQLDIRCRRKIDQRVREAANASARGVLILIDSPLLTYGFIVLISRIWKKRLAAGQFSRTPALYGSKIVPMKVIRLDDSYIAQRNVPSQSTLARKRIALVGCGTIGGYLADMLVKAGCGASGGKLTLVDNDMLMPQNIGRHRLGFPGLFKNKAIALVDELVRGAPCADVNALPVDAREANLAGYDLVIDATGEEALGNWLSAIYSSSTPMISVWIEGAGIAVRALFRDKKAGACYRCLTDFGRQGRYRAVIGDMPLIHAGQGCEAQYVPFPASVSVQAAGLGTEMVLAWANNNYSPSLRTKVLDNKYTLGTPDCDPERNTDCPACSI